MTTKSGYSMATLKSFMGMELGASSWVTVGQARINEFAKCTGDAQWIHVDVERAERESPFGGPVAHGFLTLSLLAALSEEIGIAPHDAAAAFNYGLNKVRFITPVKAGARVRARVTLVEVTDQGAGRQLAKLTNSIEIEGESKPALVAETLVVLVEAA